MLTAQMQAALYYNRLRHRPRPVAYSFAQVPDATLHSGETITVIDRVYRLATSNGTTWKWNGTTTDIS